MHLNRNTLLIALSLIILWFVWGNNSWATKIAIANIPPLLMSGICYIIAGTIFLCWSLFRHNKKLIRDLNLWKQSLLIGVIMLLGGQGMRAIGEQYISSGTTALLFSTVPLWIAIIGVIYFRNSKKDIRFRDGIRSFWSVANSIIIIFY
jgi:drug/metabolite transporter (DMT)-like permease